jgi:hypothetical protein
MRVKEREKETMKKFQFLCTKLEAVALSRGGGWKSERLIKVMVLALNFIPSHGFNDPRFGLLPEIVAEYGTSCTSRKSCGWVVGVSKVFFSYL